MQLHKVVELTRKEPVLRYNYSFDLTKIKTNILNSTVASVMIFSSIAGTLPMLFTQKAFALSSNVCIAGCTYETLQPVIDASAAGDTLILGGNVSLDHQLTINKSLTIIGNNHTIFAPFTMIDSSNNAALGIIGAANVSVSNVIIDGTGGIKLHGINVYKSTAVNLTNVTSKNNAQNGLVVNGSTVTVNNITTAANGWGGIDVDLGSGVTSPAVLTVTGQSFQSEPAAIVVDDINKPVAVNDVNNQYTATQITPAMRVYTLKPVPVCTAGVASFDSFNLGSINGQYGWQSTGSYDQAIVPNSYGYPAFGCKALRLSNGVASGSFGDQTFSYSTANEAGETTATNNGMSGGTRQNHYEAQFDIGSTSAAVQPGLAISVSPDRGDGSRMSYLRFEDTSVGTTVYFDDVQGITANANFVETNIATLNRAVPHTIKFAIDYVDGPSNDVVKIYIDGALVHTGTTWENYYRFDPESGATNLSRTTDSLLFRAGGTSVPANLNKGFLFDNVVIATSMYDRTAPVVTDNFDFNVSFQVGNKLTLAPVVTDDSAVTYLWQVSDSKLAVVNNDPAASMTGPTLTLGPSPKGNYTVTLTVTDVAGNSTVKTYSVSVTLPPTAAPQATKPAVKPAAAVTVATANNPQVLGATTTEPVTVGQVKGAETTTPNTAKLTTTNASTTKSANFIGLGWWWLAVVGAIVGFGLLFSRYLGTNKKA